MSATRAVTIAPMLSVRQGARAVEFYEAAFGAVEAFRIDAPERTSAEAAAAIAPEP